MMPSNLRSRAVKLSADKHHQPSLNFQNPRMKLSEDSYNALLVSIAAFILLLFGFYSLSLFSANHEIVGLHPPLSLHREIGDHFHKFSTRPDWHDGHYDSPLEEQWQHDQYDQHHDLYRDYYKQHPQIDGETYNAAHDEDKIRYEDYKNDDYYHHEQHAHQPPRPHQLNGHVVEDRATDDHPDTRHEHDHYHAHDHNKKVPPPHSHDEYGYAENQGHYHYHDEHEHEHYDHHYEHDDQHEPHNHYEHGYYAEEHSANAMQTNTMQTNTTQTNTTQTNTTQTNTTQTNTTPANTTQANTTQANTTQANTTQAITTQAITTQANTAQVISTTRSLTTPILIQAIVNRRSITLENVFLTTLVKQSIQTIINPYTKTHTIIIVVAHILALNMKHKESIKFILLQMTFENSHHLLSGPNASSYECVQASRNGDFLLNFFLRVSLIVYWFTESK
ncbi:unnamed protein product [Agarophyton chilense]